MTVLLIMNFTFISLMVNHGRSCVCGQVPPGNLACAQRVTRAQYAVGLWDRHNRPSQVTTC